MCDVGGLFDYLASGLQGGVELAKQVIDGTGAFFAATHFVVPGGRCAGPWSVR
jgi:hypothetical protein